MCWNMKPEPLVSCEAAGQKAKAYAVCATIELCEFAMKNDSGNIDAISNGMIVAKRQ